MPLLIFCARRNILKVSEMIFSCVPACFQWFFSKGSKPCVSVLWNLWEPQNRTLALSSVEGKLMCTGHKSTHQRWWRKQRRLSRPLDLLGSSWYARLSLGNFAGYETLQQGYLSTNFVFVNFFWQSQASQDFETAIISIQSTCIYSGYLTILQPHVFCSKNTIKKAVCVKCWEYDHSSPGSKTKTWVEIRFNPPSPTKFILAKFPFTTWKLAGIEQMFKTAKFDF